MENRISIGIIGLGVMGQGHLKTLLEDVPQARVAAVCDTEPNRFGEAEDKGLLAQSIERFDDYRKLIDSGLCDAVAVVTPHPCHAEITQYAFSKNRHVMCDKPICITPAEADAMIADWKKTDRVFCAMHSKRTTSVHRVVKQWIDEGKLGRIQRVDMVCATWLRSQAYYDSQSWRGTWQGEGAGMLLNQAPHNLDLLYWLFGPARTVEARIASRFHRMETEDEVDARLFMEAGYPVRFYGSTGEVSGLDRVEVIGTKGSLFQNGDSLIFRELEEPCDVVIRETPKTMPTIAFQDHAVEIPKIERGHKIIFRDFLDAILQGRASDTLIAPGYEGIHAVEWANAMILSSVEKRDVSLPLDRPVYDQLLKDLRAGKRSI